MVTPFTDRFLDTLDVPLFLRKRKMKLTGLEENHHLEVSHGIFVETIMLFSSEVVSKLNSFALTKIRTNFRQFSG